MVNWLTCETMAHSRRRGLSYVEMVLAMFLLALVALMGLPSARTSRDHLTAQTVAEELVARLRQARQTALTKGIPVALAVPQAGAVHYSDTVFQLEGDINPRVTNTWKIEQESSRVVFFVGRWAGPSWQTMAARSGDVALADWWNPPANRPSAHLFAFSPSGELIADALSSAGSYHILVGQGLVASGDLVTRVNSPWTVSLDPSGKVEARAGVYGASLASNPANFTPVGVNFSRPAGAVNRAPQVLTVSALPNTRNPAAAGNLLDVTSCLTLDFSVQDPDGDPPFFQWSTSEVKDELDQPLDATVYGGTFGQSNNCRMEWSKELKKWVGRTTWTPARTDRGGYSYKLTCRLDDRRGATVDTGFPVTGYLVTTKDPLILYKTLTNTNRWELWRMNLLGQDHQRLVSFPTLNVNFGQWTPSGEDVIVANDTGVWRAKADGSGLRRINQPADPPIRSCCLSPNGDSVFYQYGPGDTIGLRSITLNLAGLEVENQLITDEPLDEVFNLSAALVDGRVFVFHNYYREWATWSGTERRSGVYAYDATRREAINSVNPPPSLLVGQNRRLTGGLSVSEDGTKAYWGEGGNIRVADVVLTPAGAPVTQLQFHPGPVIATGRADVHHPRPVPGHSGEFVFADGRGMAARLYHYQGGTSTPLPLGPDNLCADEPSLSP